jgi:hypothetical protein
MEKVHQGGCNFILQDCKPDFFFSFVRGLHHVNIFSSSAPGDFVTALLAPATPASTASASTLASLLERHGHHVRSFLLLIIRRILPLVAVAFLLLVWYRKNLEGPLTSSSVAAYALAIAIMSFKVSFSAPFSHVRV